MSYDSKGAGAHPRAVRSMRPSRLPMGDWRTLARIGGIVAGLVGIFVAPVVATMIIPRDISTGLRVVAEKSTLLLVPALLALLIARPIGERALGTKWNGWLKTVLWALGGAIVLNVVVHFAETPGTPGMGQQLRDTFGFGQNSTNDALLILAIVLIAPIAEELFFRGLFHRGLRDLLGGVLPSWVSIAVATIASTLLFVMIHGDPSQTSMFWGYLVFGLVTAIAYEATGSLLAPVLLHVGSNAWAVGKGLLDLGQAGQASSWLVILVVAAPILAIALTKAIGALMSPLGGERRETRSA